MSAISENKPNLYTCKHLYTHTTPKAGTIKEKINIYFISLTQDFVSSRFDISKINVSFNRWYLHSKKNNRSHDMKTKLKISIRLKTQYILVKDKTEKMCTTCLT